MKLRVLIIKDIQPGAWQGRWLEWNGKDFHAFSAQADGTSQGAPFSFNETEPSGWTWRARPHGKFRLMAGFQQAGIARTGDRRKQELMIY
jgi:hypothetical protein